MSEAAKNEANKPPLSRRLIAFLPLAIFAILSIAFLSRIFGGDPARLPSALIGKKVPEFSLPALPGATQAGAPVPGFSSADLAKPEKLALVNVFASWCAPCREEHPLLMALAKDPRLAIYGINQKDRPENARRFLESLGNPYRAIGVDADGRASIEWGVYGVPETFLVDRRGMIVFKWVGPLTPESIRKALEPAIAAAQ